MGLFSNLNKVSNRKWSINTDGFKYKKCNELLLNHEYRLRGCFITADNGYGRGAVLITDDCFVNAPQSIVDDIETINTSDDYAAEIEAGHAGFIITTYESKKYKRTCYDVKFIDM